MTQKEITLLEAVKGIQDTIDSVMKIYSKYPMCLDVRVPEEEILDKARNIIGDCIDGLQLLIRDTAFDMKITYEELEQCGLEKYYSKEERYTWPDFLFPLYEAQRAVRNRLNKLEAVSTADTDCEEDIDIIKVEISCLSAVSVGINNAIENAEIQRDGYLNCVANQPLTRA